MLYSGQHEETTEDLVAAFEKATGIGVTVRYNDEDVFTDEILSEAPHPRADVFYTENSPPLEYLQDRHMLAPVPASALARVPERYDSPTGDWLGVSARVSVLIYNPSLIAATQLPRTVLQLASRKYRGKLAFAAGETDFQPIVTAVARRYGDAKALSWLRGIKANAGTHIYADNETISAQVNRGAVAFGVVNQYYWYRMGAELGRSHIHSRITYFAPYDPGYVVDVSGAAVLKSSKHQAAAKKFLAFLVSRQGQEIIAHSHSYEYPLLAGVSPGAPETPFGQLKPYPITVAELGDGSLAISLLQKAGLL
ncbi:MAG TPA: extracellular solute-binding protein [Acidimicrobiales bacterium]|nr:extracellular solute-binding protein [Acidimicrobiales bacterium]